MEVFLLTLIKNDHDMITKSQIINTLDLLPEKVTIDQVVDHLIYVEKVQKGLDDSINRKTKTKEEARRKLNKWLK